MEKFDAIVVGAGLAGSAAAYKLAQAGLGVLVVERGKNPGVKNMIGGVLFGPELGELAPNFWEEAPVERHITRQVITFLSEQVSLSIDLKSSRFDNPPYNGFAILRAKFDRWLAQRVEQAGAIVAAGLRADDLLWEGSRVVGIKAGGDELPAQVVIAADGVNSILAQKAGLRGELSPKDVNQGVKEVIKLPRETIEERFNLSGDQGAANTFLGFCTRGVHGGGFIYTNKDSLSLGVAVQLSALIESKLTAADLIEEFKSHPQVANLIRGGEVVEYSAHLIPAGGLRMMPRLYTDGFLVAGDAAALVLATGRVLEGANFALRSGMLAAEAVIMARERDDFSKESLSCYQQLLRKNFVLEDLHNFSGGARFLENPRIYSMYPELACGLAERVFTSDGTPKKKLWQIAREEMRGKVSLWQLVRDGLGVRRI